MVKGEITHELELDVSSSRAWELYGTLTLAKLVEEKLSSFVSKIDIVHGDGATGTVLHLFFPPGNPGFSDYKEAFTNVDDEKRVKEAEVIQGGYLDLGFTLYRVRYEITDAGHSSCVVRSSIQYELNDESAANVSFIKGGALAAVAVIAKGHLTKAPSHQ